MTMLSRPSQNQSDIVRLFIIADPCVHRHGDDLAMVRNQRPQCGGVVSEPAIAGASAVLFKQGRWKRQKI